jgi:hypothetical protein
MVGVTSPLHSLTQNGRKHFHNRLVTSNLAPGSELDQNGQSAGGRHDRERNRRKSRVLKILTSNSFALRIYEEFLANPMIPLDPGGKGGIETTNRISKKSNPPTPRKPHRY